MRLSTEERATGSPLMHSIDGAGRFWEHSHPLSFGPLHVSGKCFALPHPPAEGSMHRLRSPTGEPETFVWAGDAWLAQEGYASRRLGFTPDCLESRGWVYLGAVSEQPAEPVQESENTATPRRSRRSRE